MRATQPIDVFIYILKRKQHVFLVSILFCIKIHLIHKKLKKILNYMKINTESL